MRKARLGAFLAQNPFPDGLTDGLFYREKMRAIHRVAPVELGPSGQRGRVLDIGGGQSGLAKLLYPEAEVVTIDLDPSLAPKGAARPGSSFVCGDATRLPFADHAFDLVGLFDVLEHIDDDQRAVAEARRVTRPGGHILASTPIAAWRYPYYPFMAPVCPPEAELMARWGHVRRGYSDAQLEALIGGPPVSRAAFINPLTALAHDIAFSRLGRRRRLLLHAVVSPVTAAGYLLPRRGTAGVERVGAWRC